MHLSRSQLQVGAAAAIAAAAFVHERSWRAERRNPPAGRFAEVDGVRLHYVERGSGTPLVMLHGIGGMATELMLSPLFSFAAARYRVIAVDRPGYGYSTRPRGRLWTPQAQAALVRQLLVRLGVERPVVFGHSYGALVALSLALAYPAALRGLVLASGCFFPTTRLDVPLMAPPALPLIGDVMRHTVSPLLARLLWPALVRLVFRPAPVPAYFSRFPVWLALRPSQLRADAEDTAFLLPSVIALQRRYAGLETPSFVVAGTQDRYVDHRRHSVRLATLAPQAELLLSPRAGHMVHHTDPRRVFQAIEAAAR